MADKSSKSEAELFEEERADSDVPIHPATETQNIFSASTTDDLKPSSYDELQVASTRPEEDRLLDDGSGEEAAVPVPNVGDRQEIVVVWVEGGSDVLEVFDPDDYEPADGEEDPPGTYAVVGITTYTTGKGKEKETTTEFRVIARGLADYPGPQGDPKPDPIETKKERVEESKL